ncbi:TerB N-terminal domain-containing protein [Parvibaculum sp.]|uniref:TerB N-terminal domain-containing protein n=1 Tax=Parvibaculum sp. TaxID=2024848 RepID=UPI00391D0D4B
MTFIRLVSLYGLYFIACMFAVVTVLQDWSDEAQALFAFTVPGLLVWVGERRRSARKDPKSHEPKSSPERLPVSGSRPLTRGAVGKNVGWMEHKGPKGWIQKNEAVDIGGRSLGGMIYVGAPPLLSPGGHGKCRAYIDPSLPVAKAGTDMAGESMPYWPGYSDIPAECRATYLDWLAGGRTDASYNPGYMFLYFYGLERRFLVDRPSNDEKREILDEVIRLQKLYEGNGSARRYLGSFIELAKLDLNDNSLQEPIFENSGWEIPLSLKMALGAKVVAGEALSSDWILSWLMCHPERNLRTPATRCPEEFKALFKLRFDEKFPDGLKVHTPKKVLKEGYRAASGEFHVDLNPALDGQPIPDISNLKKPVNIAQKIADQVMDELDKFSRFIGRKPDGRGSLEAQALLPADLRQIFPSAELENLKAWARSRVEAGGLTPVTDLIARLEGGESGKIGKRQLTDAADVLARVGFGMAPDPRFSLRAPKIGEPVVIFDFCAPVEKLEQVSARYHDALMELALGTFVAHADGHVTDAEHLALRNRIVSTKELSEQEQKRLLADLDWLIAVPPNMSLLRQKLKDASPEQQASIRAAVVAIAHADTVVQSDEVAEIEKIYKALGIDPNAAYNDLHAGRVLDEPVAMRGAEPGAPGETIPPDPSSAISRLDPERIAAIRSDTKRVSSVLGDIFSTDEPNDTDGDEPPALSSALAGLSVKHAGLVVEIIERQHWSEEEFLELSGRHELMPSGTLEALNEWAFEKYDEALLDEYDGYDVSPNISATLKEEIGA